MNDLVHSVYVAKRSFRMQERECIHNTGLDGGSLPGDLQRGIMDSDRTEDSTAKHAAAASGSGALESSPAVAPRCYAFTVGQMQCVSLSDGGIVVPLPDAEGSSPRLIVLPLSCLLVRLPDGGPLVLIDAGFGWSAKPHLTDLPTLGKVPYSLALAGAHPEDVDVVIASHIHPDHIGGFFDARGAKAFPNATYYAGEDEVTFWSDERLDISGAPPPGAAKVEMVEAAASFLRAAGGELRRFASDEEIVPGITAIAAPGHTPGQVGFLLSNGGKSLLYTADAFGAADAARDFSEPVPADPFDLEPDSAAATREAFVGLLADTGWLMFTPHFPWPSVGEIRTVDGRRSWQAHTA